MKQGKILVYALLSFSFLFFHGHETRDARPNVLFIMVDDLGVDGISIYGSKVDTPNIDALAKSNGVMVSHCFAQPNCTPSRVKLMTGMCTYKSYDRFAYLNPEHKTIGNLMKEAGYKTCIAGKWQLNGNPRMSGYVEEHNHKDRAYQAGFDEYHLHNYTFSEGKRYADSEIESNGKRLKGEYGPDMHRDFIIDFIRRNKQQPFFIYYPMVLVHGAYDKTPDSEDWHQTDKNKSSNEYLVDMIRYTDKIVGHLVETLKQENLYENTIIIFTSDNGTGRGGTINTVNGFVRGGKGTMKDAGTRVPLIIHNSQKIEEFKRWKGLIDFSDFYPTFADIAGIDLGNEKNLDGISFYPLVSGDADIFKSREILFMHHDPRRDDNQNRIRTDSENRNRFARTIEYKLYQTGEFYHVDKDPLEEDAIDIDSLDEQMLEIYKKLKSELDRIDRKYPWEDIWPSEN